MNFNGLLAFHAVAREGNFTKAAKRLSLSQPAITRRILDIEQYYGVRLFERTSRRIILTRPGKTLLSYVERILAMTNEAEVTLQSWAQLKSGRLEIGTSRPIANYYVPAIVVAFKRLYPGIVPSIHVENSQWVLDEILGFRLDLGIIGMKPKIVGLVVSPFLDEELVIVVNKQHRWAKRKSVRLEELDGEPLIHRERGSGTRQLIDSRVARLGIKPNVAMEAGSNETIKKAVETGIGVALFPPAVIDFEVKQGLFSAIKIEGARLALSFNVAYLEERESSPLIQAFLGVLKSEHPRLVGK